MDVMSYRKQNPAMPGFFVGDISMLPFTTLQNQLDSGIFSLF